MSNSPRLAASAQLCSTFAGVTWRELSKDGPDGEVGSSPVFMTSNSLLERDFAGLVYRAVSEEANE